MGVAIGCESEYKGDYVSQRIGAPAKHKKDRGVALNQYRQATSVAGGLEEVKNAPAPRCRWPSSCARVKDTGNRNVCTYHYPCDGRHPGSRKAGEVGRFQSKCRGGGGMRLGRCGVFKG